MGVDPLTLGLSIGIPVAAIIIGYAMYYNSTDQKDARYHKKWDDTDIDKLTPKEFAEYEKDDMGYMTRYPSWFWGGSKKRRRFGASRRIKRSKRRL